MRVFIAGIDGYLGWALSQHLVNRGHEVAGMDNFLRRELVAEMKSQSATFLLPMEKRLQAFREFHKTDLSFSDSSLCDYDAVLNIFQDFEPEAIVHLAEMPSAPYSMIDVDQAVFTHQNNLIGTLNTLYAMKEVCPDAHLLKLGTMGEYGAPNVDIPEGFFEVEYRGRKDRLPFPRQPSSIYDLTKVHDSANVHFACKTWGLRSTDIMQGVVFGTRIDAMGDDPRMLTRFDFDQAFGTVINRFCAQAIIGLPLTPYGKGTQKRGFTPLRDSIQCYTLALENPPDAGEYRVFNQFEESYYINDLADKVANVANNLGFDTEVRHIENPRIEKEKHYFNPDHKLLFELGYEPTHDMEKEIEITFKDLMINKDRIEQCREAIMPNIRWSGDQGKCKFIEDESERNNEVSTLRLVVNGS